MSNRHTDFDRCYRAVQSKDARFDGWFVTAVLTTGIYCRPSCPVRPPFACNVRFYPAAAAAQRAGFRACKRCRTDASPGSPQWNMRGDVVSRTCVNANSTTNTSAPNCTDSKPGWLTKLNAMSNNAIQLTAMPRSSSPWRAQWISAAMFTSIETWMQAGDHHNIDELSRLVDLALSVLDDHDNEIRADSRSHGATVASSVC